MADSLRPTQSVISVLIDVYRFTPSRAEPWGIQVTGQTLIASSKLVVL